MNFRCFNNGSCIIVFYITDSCAMKSLQVLGDGN